MRPYDILRTFKRFWNNSFGHCDISARTLENNFFDLSFQKSLCKTAKVREARLKSYFSVL